MTSVKQTYQTITSRLGIAASAIVGHLPPKIKRDMDMLISQVESGGLQTMVPEKGEIRMVERPSFLGSGYDEMDRVIKETIRGLQAYSAGGYSQADDYIGRLLGYRPDIKFTT